MDYPVTPPEPPAIVNYESSQSREAEAIAPELAKVNPPLETETLGPEFSQASSNAALLGPPMEVSSPLKPVKSAAPERSTAEAVPSPQGDRHREKAASKQLPELEPSSTEDALRDADTENQEFTTTLNIGLDWMLSRGEDITVTPSSPVEANREAENPTFVSPLLSTGVEWMLNRGKELAPTPTTTTSPRIVAKGETRDVYPERRATTVRESPRERESPQSAAEAGKERGEQVARVEEESAAEETAIAPAQTIELKADRQEFDRQRQIATAEGNAQMRARGALLDAEQLQVNLETQIAVAQGDVVYAKGQQVLQGDRLEYDMVQNRGGMDRARGDIFVPTTGQDFGPTLPTDVSPRALQQQNLVDRLRAGEPPNRIRPTGAISIGAGVGGGVNVPQTAGTINRVRFESDRLNFSSQGWEGRNVRLTNDPFSPPELEIRADRVTFRQLSPQQDEIVATRPRLVFDDFLSIPLLKERFLIDRRDRDPSLIRFGYDRNDRGGVYAETTWVPPNSGNDPVQLRILPQFYLQRSLEEGTGNLGRLWGVKADLEAYPGPRTFVEGSAELTNLDFNDGEENLRASLRLRQGVANHVVTGEYSYRDRLFNGSLGYQTVHQNVGMVIASPVISLWKTGINLSYQASAQHITADSDRLELLEPVRENNRIQLGRYQASAAVSKSLVLWKGEELPRTRTQGLRYTPAPVTPYIRIFGGLTGVATAYTSDDIQNSLTGSIGIQGQFGHFARRWLDYTGFNLSLSRVWFKGESPFIFDRIADSKVLSAGLTQQLYGPFRAGVQTSFNLDTGERISTDLTLEYSRRTYGIRVNYNPERREGSLSLSINDFNWTGGGQPF